MYEKGQHNRLLSDGQTETRIPPHCTMGIKTTDSIRVRDFV
jgi:hypothetical protein